MNEQLSLIYRGAPVDEGRLDAYAAARSITAFSDFLGRASRTAYGNKVELRTEIQGIRDGSFKIQFAVDLLGATATVLSLATPPTGKDLIQLGAQVLGLFQHLRGESPKSVTPAPGNSSSLAVENQHGEITYVTADTVNIISDPQAAKAAQAFAGRPLSEGMSSVHLASGECQELFTATDEQATYFQPLDIERKVNEYEAQMGLFIEAPVFKEGNKWKFYDGQTTFWADIEDEVFLSSVNEGRRFGKGDWLVAKVRVEQTTALNDLHAKRSIVEVLDHKARPEQQDGFSNLR